MITLCFTEFDGVLVQKDGRDYAYLYEKSFAKEFGSKLQVAKFLDILGLREAVTEPLSADSIALLTLEYGQTGLQCINKLRLWWCVSYG